MFLPIIKNSVTLCVCRFPRATLDDVDSDEAAGLGRKAIIPSSVSAETLSSSECISQIYRKSLRLTSEQIVRRAYMCIPWLGIICSLREA